MQVTVHNSIESIAVQDWNALSGAELPFLRHEFLALGEATGCVGSEQGWLPRHLTIEGDGGLRAAMPLYEKSHSWGEFVFDWAWANAYEQAGLRYYPRLVSATPFTPCPGPRLLLADTADEAAAQRLLRAAVSLANDSGCSSLHVQFPDEREIYRFREAGLLLRKDCQFHWHNRDFDCFDDFLATFTSSKRKKARRDRRRVAENGIRFRHLSGSQMSGELWTIAYELISRTFIARGSLPYYNLAFFSGLGAALPDNVLVVLAEKRDRPIAAAVFFLSDTRLYGRYWGSDAYYDALHFETCYYQGIEYCIANKLQVFEPGTQGEHKISRGFSPVNTWSAHWLRHPEFADAIERYLDQESRHVDRYVEAVESHSPYRKTPQPDG